MNPAKTLFDNIFNFMESENAKSFIDGKIIQFGAVRYLPDYAKDKSIDQVVLLLSFYEIKLAGTFHQGILADVQDLWPQMPKPYHKISHREMAEYISQNGPIKRALLNNEFSGYCINMFTTKNMIYQTVNKYYITLEQIDAEVDSGGFCIIL